MSARWIDVVLVRLATCATAEFGRLDITAMSQFAKSPHPAASLREAPTLPANGREGGARGAVVPNKHRHMRLPCLSGGG